MAPTSALRIDPSNADQLQAWDGEEGAYWAAHADRFDRCVAAYRQPLFVAAAIGETDRVLDFGCGTGQTTLDAARAAVHGTALGVDLSARMLDVARRRATEAGLANISFQQADAQIHAFDKAAYDVAISRTGAMFFSDPVAAFTNIGRALVNGGRLALLTWQPLAANEWIRDLSGALAAGRDLPAPPRDLPGPFSLSDPARVHGTLTAAGFTEIELEATAAGMWFGDDVDDAHRFVLGLMGWMLQGLDDTGRARAEDGLRATLAAHQMPDGVVFGSAAWTIRATRP